MYNSLWTLSWHLVSYSCPQVITSSYLFQYSLLWLFTVILKLLGLHSYYHCSGFINLCRYLMSHFIYSQWDLLDESSMMQSKANAHNHWFLRYKQFSVWWLLISWSLGGFLRCWGLPSIIEKVFLRAFQCSLDCQKRPSICGDRSKWSLWHTCRS